jgi:cation diffusion facilitator family transporter
MNQDVQEKLDEHDAAVRRRDALKQNTAWLSIIVTFTLSAVKLAVGIITGSLAVISEALHSMLDLAAALVAFFSIREAGKPPDKEHPFGHHKFEAMGAFIEGLLIFAPYIYILVYSIRAISSGKIELRSLEMGIWVMAASIALNAAVAARLYYVAHRTKSLALSGDGLHLSVDALTSVVVLVTLVIIKATNVPVLDPIIAAVISLFVIGLSMKLLWRSGRVLVDTAPSDDTREKIVEVIAAYRDKIVDVHDMRIGGARDNPHVDFHLTLCRSMTLDETHALCDDIERDVKKVVVGADVIIHTEPSDDQNACDDKAAGVRCVLGAPDSAEVGNGVAKKPRRA